MPTSYHGYIVDCIEAVRAIKPESILDIGVGFGKWGHLFREYLDVMPGRPFKGEWKIKIDGIEVFPKYIQAHQKYIYNTIFIGNCLNVLPENTAYDLVFMSDVLEHIDKEDAKPFINKVLQKCKAFILNVPLGPVWLKQGELYGNKYEAHISAWELTDFANYKQLQKPKIYLCNNKQIGMFVLRGTL